MGQLALGTSVLGGIATVAIAGMQGVAINVINVVPIAGPFIALTIVLTIANQMWQAVLSRRQETAGEVRDVWAVGAVDPKAIARLDLINALTAQLLQRGGLAMRTVAGVVGGSGFGKTTLAQQVCATDAVRERFRGGAVMVTIGENAKGVELANKINYVISRFTRETNERTDPDMAGAELAQLLDGRRDVLLVVDDVWRAEQLRPFLHGGATCVRLVTTRMPDVLAGLVDNPILVEGLERSQAREVVTAGVLGLDRRLTDRLIAATTSSPMTLRLANARLVQEIKSKVSPAEAAARLAERFERYGPTTLDLGDVRDRAVGASIEASIELLSDQERALLPELTVFPEDAPIDQSMLDLLWRFRHRALDIDKFLDRLAAHSLVAEHQTTPRRVRLHDIIRKYLRTLAGDEFPAYNRRLVDAIRAQLPDTNGTTAEASAWWHLPDDAEYAWRHLCRHLAEAHLDDELSALVFDPRWLTTKLALLGTGAVVSDLDLVPGPVAKELSRAIARNAHVLATIEPRHALSDILVSRLEGIPALAPIVAAYHGEPRRTPRLAAQWSLPDRPDPALIGVLQKHEGMVNACVVDSEGAFAVTAGWDGTANVWDAATGKPRQTLTGHTDRLLSCAISPDGSWIATTSRDGTARIWEARTGKQRQVLSGHADGVGACAIEPRGSWLVTIGREGAARIWNQSGQLIRVLDPITKRQRKRRRSIPELIACAVGADGSWLATTSSDGSTHVWDSATGELRHTLRGHTGHVVACAVAPSGTWLLTAGRDGTARIWDVERGEVRHVLRGHTAELSACAISADGRWIVTTSHDHTAKIWDAIKGTMLHDLIGHTRSVVGCAIVASGDWVATASVDETARIWDAHTGGLRNTLKGHAGWVVACAAMPGQSRLLTASADGTARIWDVDVVSPAHVLTGRARDVVSSVAPLDGSWLATTNRDNTAQLWEVVSGELKHTLSGHHGQIASSAVAPDGSWLLTTSHDHTAKVWDATDGTCRVTLRGHGAPVVACDIAPDGEWALTASHDKTAMVWSSATGQVLRRIEHAAAEQVSCAISPNGMWLVTGGSDGVAHMSDAATGALRYVLPAVPGQHMSCAWSSDSSWLVTASGTKAQIWEAATGVRTRELIGHTKAVISCAISHDGSWLITTSEDGTAMIWDRTTGDAIHVLKGHSGPVVACAIASDDRWIVTASFDGTARIWDLTGQCQTAMRVTGPLTVCLCLPRDQVFLAGKGGAYLLTYVPATRSAEMVS